jgi:hypothetical protein
MAVTLLGADATAALLGGRGRVAVVNHTAAESDVVIVAAAIVRHRDGEDPHTDVTYALEIGAEQSVEIEAAPPLTEPPDATEVVLRLRIGDAARADAYAVAHRDSADASGRVEFGIKDNDGVLVDGEEIVTGFPEFAIYVLTTETTP